MEAAPRPGPSQEVETGLTASTSNASRTCPFCQASLSFNSLLNHLDQFIRDRNPSPVDGIHDADEIRRIRGKSTKASRKGPFPFLRLPPELRNRIYELHLNRGRDNNVVWDGDTMGVRYTGNRVTMRRCVAAMLRPSQTCRQVYAEFLPLFYTQSRFHFTPYSVQNLFAFLMGIGPERCRLLRHVALRSYMDSWASAPEENIISVIEPHLESKECSPWNDRVAYKQLLSALWQYRKDSGLQAKRYVSEQWDRGVFRRDDNTIKYLILYGQPGAISKDFPLPPGWERGVDDESKKRFVHTTSESVDRVIRGWSLSRFVDELGNAFFENQDISLAIP